MSSLLLLVKRLCVWDPLASQIQKFVTNKSSEITFQTFPFSEATWESLQLLTAMGLLLYSFSIWKLKNSPPSACGK